METILSKIPFHKYRTLKYLLWIGSLIAYLILNDMSGWDVDIQHLFFQNHHWLIDADSQDFLRLMAYTAPKTLLLIGGILLLCYAIFAGIFPQKSFFTQNMLYILLNISFIPLIVASLKAITNVYCPYQLDIFNGFYQHTWLWQNNLDIARGRCFPAGHASGACSLVCLWFMNIKHSARRLIYSSVVIFIILTAGYQMMNGRHFLSHTITTLWIALSWAWFCKQYLSPFIYQKFYEKSASRL